MRTTPLVDAWNAPSRLVDEREFTPWAEDGWDAWNGHSPEMQVVGFVCALIGMMRPHLILETGVGQGYMTRYIAEMLDAPQLLIAYESDDDWRAALWPLPFWPATRGAAQLSHNRTPLEGDIASADLCIFDSDFEVRFTEVQRWHDFAKPGTVALIHDTADQPGTIHQSLRELIGDLGMTGVFLKNPRGCFMAIQR
jgi:hypothetical protein